MTINSATRKAGPFLGDGVATSFPFTFKIFTKNDVQATLTDANGVETTLVLDSDFSVTVNADQTVSPGGSVTYPATLAIGKKLTLTGAIQNLQPTSWPNNGPWYPKTVEDAFDHAVILIQQLREQIDRAIKISVSDATLNPLPAAAARANYLLGFDALGNNTLFPISASVGAGDMRVDPFSSGTDFTPGVTTSLVLSRAPGNPDNVEVFFDGVYQGPDQWTVTGTTLTFSGAIPVGVSKVFVRSGTTLSTSIPPNRSVGDAQMSWGNVLNRVVDSIAALRNISKAVYSRTFVTGYYGVGDGGGGPYALDPADTTSADNGGTIIVATDGGRWKLQLTGPVSVKQFGAKGDGATNDSPAFQACVDAIDPSGEIYVPEGTFILNAALNIAAVSGADSGLTFRGGGIGSLIKPGASVSTLFNVTGKNVAIEGVFFQNVSSLATTAITCTTASADAGYSTRIKKNYITGFANGISASGQNYDIYENWFQNNTNDVLFTNDGRNSSIHGNYMLGGNNGIVLQKTAQQAEGVRIFNNTILKTLGSGSGITINAGLDIFIGHNVIDQTGPNSPGIYMPAGANTIAKVKIIGNWIAAGQNSYSVFANGNNNEISISANSIMSNNGLAAAAGISLSNTNGYQVVYNNFGIVTGNDFDRSSVSNGTIHGNTSSQGSGSNAIGNYTDQDFASNGKITSSRFEVVSGGPDITQGVGDPNGVISKPAASIRFRPDGGAGGRLYVCAGGTVWTPVAGV